MAAHLAICLLFPTQCIRCGENGAVNSGCPASAGSVKKGLFWLVSLQMEGWLEAIVRCTARGRAAVCGTDFANPHSQPSTKGNPQLGRSGSELEFPTDYSLSF